jgi:hypothetical protein
MVNDLFLASIWASERENKIELQGNKVPHFTRAEASPTSFVHAGASGCLAWFDTTARVAWAILGSRTFESWWQSWSVIGAALLTATN